MLWTSWINDTVQGLRKKTPPPGWGIKFSFSLKTCPQKTRKIYQSATLNQAVPPKGKFTLLLQQPWNNSSNLAFRINSPWTHNSSSFLHTPAKALQHTLFQKNAFHRIHGKSGSEHLEEPECILGVPWPVPEPWGRQGLQLRARAPLVPQQLPLPSLSRGSGSGAPRCLRGLRAVGGQMKGWLEAAKHRALPGGMNSSLTGLCGNCALQTHFSTAPEG